MRCPYRVPFTGPTWGRSLRSPFDKPVLGEDEACPERSRRGLKANKGEAAPVSHLPFVSSQSQHEPYFPNRPLLIVFVSLIILSGCSFGREHPTRFYGLTMIPPEEATQRAVSLRNVAIGVGPVELPQYTNRPQIVTGDNTNELRPAAFAHWAEPLQDNFTRVLAENLSLLLATDRVAVFPWKGPMPMEYQVIVEVTRFLGELGGQSSLVALWSIVGKNGKEVLVSKRSSFSEPLGSQEYEALAAAMSRNIAALSRDIATEITALSQQAANP